MVDTITTNFAPEVEPEEIVVDTVETDATSDETPARPEGLPENFKSVAELAEALNNTKAELTKFQQNNKADPAKATPQEAQAVATDAGVDFAKLTEEYNDNNSLTAETYSMLASKGFTKEVVDAYIEGQKAVSDRMSKEIYDIVGGEDSFKEVIEWAKGNLSAREIDAYNKSLTSDQATAKLLLSGIHARYRTENGNEPNLISGEPAGSNSDVFKSNHEMIKAMEDPRYWKDPDYQNEVRNKAERSQIAGTI